MTTTVVELSSLEWNVLLAMKEELEPDEINSDPGKHVQTLLIFQRNFH